MSAPTKIFKLLGGHPALDFANTADWHARPAPDELLTDYGRLLDWGRQVGTLTDAQADALRRVAAADPAAATAALARVVALREALYRLFSALAAGRSLPAADLATLNAALAATLPHLALADGPTGPTLGWAGPPDALDRPIWPVVRAAAELLAAPERARVRECDDGECGWLFLDTSRNRSRRWCDSRDCGNRQRVRRHYARHHERATADA